MRNLPTVLLSCNFSLENQSTWDCLSASFVSTCGWFLLFNGTREGKTFFQGLDSTLSYRPELSYPHVILTRTSAQFWFYLPRCSKYSICSLLHQQKVVWIIISMLSRLHNQVWHVPSLYIADTFCGHTFILAYFADGHAGTKCPLITGKYLFYFFHRIIDALKFKYG